MYGPPSDALVGEIGLGRLPTSPSSSPVFPSLVLSSSASSPDLDRERPHPRGRHVEERPHAARAQQQQAAAARHQLARDPRDHKRVRGTPPKASR